MSKENTAVSVDRTQEEIDANVLVLSTEAEKNTADAEEARAEAKRHGAETRQRTAEAKKAEIELARLVRAESAELAKDQYHHIYMFDDGVNSKSVESCIQKLAEWSRNEPGCEIEIIFNSPGGNIVDGLALFDYIQRIKLEGHKVTTSAMGMAASMAGVLLQAGDVRKIAPQAFLLIHEGSLGAIGNFGEVEDTMEFMKKLHDRILTIFAERSGGKLTKAKLKTKWTRKDWWLNAEEALELGLVDEIG